MSTLAAAAIPVDDLVPGSPRPKLDHPVDMRQSVVFLAIIAGALFFTAYGVWSDIEAAGGAPTRSVLPYFYSASRF